MTSFFQQLSGVTDDTLDRSEALPIGVTEATLNANHHHAELQQT